MVYRPRRNTPMELDFTHNITTLKYELQEDGITYSMDLEMTRNIKDYYRYFRSGHKAHRATVARWYADLPNEDKKKVERTGRVPSQRHDFYPDPEYPE